MEAILTAKQKERAQELERKKLEVAAEHDKELRKAAEEHRALHEDKKLRKVRYSRDRPRSNAPVTSLSTRPQRVSDVFN